MLNAIVTGASSGIGKALYEYLKKKEWNVIGISRRGPDVECDLRLHPIQTSLPINELDLLINCAGIMPLSEKAREDEIFDVNFWGTYYMIEKALPLFGRCISNDKCIINIASVSGLRGDKDLPVYAASKAAIISLTQSLALKYAPHIRVNCISPGFYNTNLVEETTPPELIQKVPLKYEEEPEELKHAVKMIWMTKYMTGANIVIDGGVSL